MAITSAQGLHDLVQTLSDQFSKDHEPLANRIWSEADAQLHHTSQEGGSWISREIDGLIEEWQEHKASLQNAEKWFAHHGPLLARVAQDPVNLATEVFAAGGAAALSGGAGQGVLDYLDKKAGDVSRYIGWSGIPDSWGKIFSASGIKKLESIGGGIEATLSDVGHGIEDLVKGVGLKNLSGKLGGAWGALGYVGSGLALGSDAYNIGKNAGLHKGQETIHSITDFIGDGLQSIPNPVTMLGGVDVKLVSDLGNQAYNLDWSHLGPFPPPSVNSMKSNYLPASRAQVVRWTRPF